MILSAWESNSSYVYFDKFRLQFTSSSNFFVEFVAMGFGRVNLEWVKEDKSIFFRKELVVQDEQTNRRNEKWIHIFEGKKEHQDGKLLRK